MAMTRTETEEKNIKKGFYSSSFLHLFVVLLLIFPFCKLPYPPPGQEGILVSFGMPLEGMGDVQPMSPEASPEASSSPASQPIAEASSPKSSSSPPPKSDPEPQKREETKPTVEKDVVTDKNADTPAIKKGKKKKDDAARKAKEKADSEAKKKSDAERKRKEEADKKEREAESKKRAAEEAKRKAEEEARQKAEAERKRKEDAKKKFGFPGNNSSTGQGTTDKPGDQGANDGDPNAENLEGDKSPGKGKDGIGVDMAGRDVKNRPSVNENSNKTGDVKVKICVNKRGEVISAKYTIRGSTTQDTDLVSLSERKAEEFRFSSNDNAPDPQCGSITFKYRVE